MIIRKVVTLSCALMFLASIAYADQSINLSNSRLSTISNKAKRLSKPANRLLTSKGKELNKRTNSIKKVSLVLKKITAIKTSEKGNDELFFDVLEFGSNRKPKHFHVPSHPHHWPSFILNKIKDITLWQGALNEAGDVNIIVSLLEKDMPPWSLNDLIGSFKINITIKDKEPQFILAQQEVNYSASQFSGKFQKELILSGDDGEYKISIVMK